MKISILSFLVFITLVSFGQHNYFVQDKNGLLYKYYPDSSCTTSYMGILNGHMDMAICPNGVIYSTESYHIYRFDTLTMTNTMVAQVFNYPTNVNSLIALNNDYLLALSGTSLFKISTLNGSKVNIGTMPGSSSAGDIVYLNGYFYLSSELNELWKFRLNEDYSALLDYEIVGILDSPFQRMYGLLKTGTLIKGTSGCHPTDTQDTQRIIGFENQQVYEIDVETAHCTLLCDTIFMDTINGAASIEIIELNPPSPPILPTVVIELPNIFTPNNDGINDYFHPTLFSEIETFEITIINRWGNTIYSSKNSEFGWNGTTSSGEKVSEGIYFYTCRYIENCSGKEMEQKGYLELIR